ncbi:KH domain-containing, RNA-binding, signal transduction-associated protein 2-like isoform X4 [Ostrinia furnacalis]|uniref:KH domain-containing, RNA-binding, signal transduction-associated protein 2-like isoform X3 n=2 Tax=Ostrinia furnacalis TaxID=93504 RepID=UPI001038CD5A|nr:KH domain-containing, RNA-binding, signal transduction-associated protein 2-like isoform X3 [Ostrinia furnacalis]XP_028159900.1 KH domain-containing, RNA-binding, signal transduction-associated protein 2-like isoform X4 [Ostrinia furnacalis]
MMAESFDKNGYNSGEFKREPRQPEDCGPMDQDGDEGLKLNDKADEYMRELLSEKIKLNNQKFPISSKLIDQEVSRVQTTGRIPAKDTKYMDVFREKPVKVTVKVLVPIKEHPQFNFVGKLLGPKGNTMKQMQEETMCKMAVLGRGSIRDRRKEEELRNSLDPKYSHLSDELHVEISALAPPAEAHARIAYALAEVKKYLVPDGMEMMRHPPIRELMDRGMPPPGPDNVMYSACTVTKRSFSYQDPVIGKAGPPRPPPGRAPPRMPPAPPMPRGMPGKTKVISILDRARNAMENSYGGYEDPYAMPPEPPVSRQPRGPPRASEQEFYYDRPDRYYDEGFYKQEERPFKASARDVGTRRPQPRPYQRHEPYARPKDSSSKRQRSQQ